MNSAPALPAKPLRTRDHVREHTEGRIYITASVDALSGQFFAKTVYADRDTREVLIRGKFFDCPVKANRWLSKQSVVVDV